MDLNDLGIIQGSRMLYPDGDRIGNRLAVKGIYEPKTVAAILRNVKPGGTMIDIGAHIGYFTLMAARAAGPEGHVYAIEPDPANFAVLVENVRLNKYENVHLIRGAAWDKEEPLTFKPGGALGQIDLASPPDENHRSGPWSRDPGNSGTVYGRRMDAQIGHLTADLIKIDTQGAEARALEGMPNAIAAAGSVIVEIWPDGLAQFGNTADDILRALRPGKFEIFVCSKEAQDARTANFGAYLGNGKHCEIYATKTGGPLPWTNIRET